MERMPDLEAREMGQAASAAGAWALDKDGKYDFWQWVRDETEDFRPQRKRVRTTERKPPTEEELKRRVLRFKQLGVRSKVK